jgi:hypothetical protein
MENSSNFQDYSYLSDHSEHQKCSVYDKLYSDSIAESWNFEGFRYKAGLDVTYFQPDPVFESENGSAQSSFTPTDFAGSQSSSDTAFGFAGENYSNSNWVSQEATEAHNWLLTSDAIAVDTNFRRESNNGVGIAEFPKAPEFVPPYDVRPTQIVSPSTIAFQQLCNEPVKPSVYTPQQGFEPLADGESGENPLYNNFLYVQPTPFLTALPL